MLMLWIIFKQRATPSAGFSRGPAVCQVCYVMHGAAFCDSSRLVPTATLSEVKGLVPSLSQEEVKLGMKTHPDPQAIVRLCSLGQPANSGTRACWNSGRSTHLPFS